MILAGDIGGTKTRLALFGLEGDRLVLAGEETFPSVEFDGLEAIVRRFLSSRPGEPGRGGTSLAGGPITGACFGVAGPVREGRSRTTNLPWVVDAALLARALGLKRAGLINDLEANGYGIGDLAPQDLAVLNPGQPDPDGQMAIISAGTGLGEAGLLREGKRLRPLPSEGGHSDFAPGTDLEIDLLRYLREREGHVSWERVLSGPGLHNLYLFLRDTGRDEEPEWLAREMRGRDPAEVISRTALERRSSLSERALDLFVRLYAAEAGNLALKMMATAGVYIGGGIAPRIIDRLKTPEFMRTFASKGRMRELLEGVPVRVILNDRTALLGAARCAALGA